MKPKLDYSKKEVKEVQSVSLQEMDVETWEVPRSEGFWSGITSFFNNWVSHALTEEEVARGMQVFRLQLIERNVANSIADEICEVVQGALVGKTISSITSLQEMIRSSMKECLLRMLTSSRELNVLYNIRQCTTRPYTIVFCGVNGVGKSTNLAKIAAYLKQQQCKVAMAACDTFRSGAIEQLRVHATALSLPLYQGGYGKEPAIIAKNAIIQARKEGTDVLLIDTAGRMQHNLPLMNALVNLITVNQVDLILFVGEALVGNDGLDQIQSFNAAIESGTKGLRSIDGIVLTKFDTIDDKMGAAISMTRITGKPIVFVGTGQQYTDLKRLSPEVVVANLLK